MDEKQTKEAPLFASRYQIWSQVGRGGMGIVYKAFDLELDRMVALKVMLDSGNHEENRTLRFLRETRAMAQLKHPNIISLIDVGDEAGYPYYTMEFVEGEDLGEFLQRKRRSGVKHSLQLVATVADAVGYAHRKGIIHRDLKPSNIMLDKSGKPIVMDFGIAKLKDDHRLTRNGMILGSVGYIAPEQAGGNAREIDESSDIYSLGCILYQMLTGVLPFRGKTDFEVLDKILRDPPTAPSSLNNRVSKRLDKVCLKAIHRDRRLRYRSADEFRRDIENCLEGKRVEAFSKPSNLVESFRSRGAAALGVVAVLFIGYWAALQPTDIPPRREQPMAPAENLTHEKAKTEQAETEQAETEQVVSRLEWSEGRGIQAQLHEMTLIHQRDLFHKPGTKYVVFRIRGSSYLHVAFPLDEKPAKVTLKFTHVSSIVRGEMHSPIDILVNGRELVRAFNVNRSGWTTTEFDMTSRALQGGNTVLIQLARDARTAYWLKTLEIIVFK